MNELIQEYIRYATQHGTATEKGDSEAANQAYERLDTLFKTIVVEGLRQELLPLLDHDQPAVRAKAAFHTLAIAPERAEAALDSVSKEASPLVGFSARMTLDQWRKGNLKPA